MSCDAQGNSMTCMLAALNPHPDNYEECFNTLQFAVSPSLLPASQFLSHCPLLRVPVSRRGPVCLACCCARCSCSLRVWCACRCATLSSGVHRRCLSAAWPCHGPAACTIPLATRPMRDQSCAYPAPRLTNICIRVASPCVRRCAASPSTSPLTSTWWEGPARQAWAVRTLRRWWRR